MTQKVHILLPVHNRRYITEKFIDCLIGQTYANYHLILIDDGSSDGTDNMVKQKVENLTIIKGSGCWWWAGSLQQGIHWLEENNTDENDIVLFVNDDVVFELAFLQKAVHILDTMENTLLLAQVINKESGLPQESGVEANLKMFTFDIASSPEKINCLSTRGLFMRMKDLRKIGGFHPFVLPHYMSDYEFTIRAYHKGMRLRTVSDLAIFMNPEQSGFRNFENSEFRIFLKQYFSKKSVSNPIYQMVFVVLACPALYMPMNILRILKAAVWHILKQLKIPIQNLYH